MIIDYLIDDIGPVIHLFWRDETGKKFHARKRFEPYLYVDPIEADTKGYQTTERKPDVYGNLTAKLPVNYPSDVSKRRNSFKKTWEAKTVFVDRYLIDNVETLPDFKYQVFYFDIEVNGMPNLEIADKEITCICAYFQGKWYEMAWHPDAHPYKIGRKCIFNSEKELLAHFAQVIQQTNPDLLTGWNVIGFDINYVILRMRRLGLSPESLSPISYINQIENSYNPSNPIKGRLALDLRFAYKKIRYGGRVLPSSTLQWVANNELGVGKLKVDFDTVWTKDLKKLIEYCRRDVDLTVRLDEKLNIVEFFHSMQKIAGCSFNSTLFNHKITEVMCLREARKRGAVLPTPVQKDVDAWEGAYILDAQPGLYDGVLCLDFKGMYPQIMVDNNISPETFSEDGDIVLPNGCKFKSEPVGIIPTMLIKLNDLRQEYIDKMNQHEKGSDQYKDYFSMQYAVKTQRASVYGYLGYPRSSMFNPTVAGAVPYMGRQYLHAAQLASENLGYNCLIGHTDSIFIQIPKDEVKNFMAEIDNEIDRILKEKSIPVINFVLEADYYDRMLIGGVNRRAAIDSESGELVITGFEAKHGNMPDIAQNIQEDTLRMILENASKLEVIKMIRDKIEGIRNDKFPLEEIAFKKRLNRDPSEYKTRLEHVRAFEYANKILHLGIPVNDSFYMLYVTRAARGYPSTTEVGFTDPDQIKGFRIDHEKIIDKTIKKKLELIFEAIGWNIEEIEGQKTMEEFFDFC